MDILTLAITKKYAASIDPSSFVRKDELGNLVDESGNEISVAEYVDAKLQEETSIIDYDVIGGAEDE